MMVVVHAHVYEYMKKDREYKNNSCLRLDILDSASASEKI